MFTAVLCLLQLETGLITGVIHAAKGGCATQGNPPNQGLQQTPSQNTASPVQGACLKQEVFGWLATAGNLPVR